MPFEFVASFFHATKLKVFGTGLLVSRLLMTPFLPCQTNEQKMATRVFQISFLAAMAVLTALAFAGMVMVLMQILHELSVRLAQAGTFLPG